MYIPLYLSIGEYKGVQSPYMTTIGELTHEFLNKFRIDGLLPSCPSHNCSHLRAHAIGRSATVARSSAVQASSTRRQERRWAIVCGSPAHPCAQSVKGSPTEPVLSRSSRDSATSSTILTEAGTSVTVRLSF